MWSPEAADGHEATDGRSGSAPEGRHGPTSQLWTLKISGPSGHGSWESLWPLSLMGLLCHGALRVPTPIFRALPCNIETLYAVSQIMLILAILISQLTTTIYFKPWSGTLGRKSHAWALSCNHGPFDHF